MRDQSTKPLEIMESVVTSPSYPGGLTVVQMPSRLLHKSQINSLVQSNLRSLQRGNAVSIKRALFDRYRLPQLRECLLIVTGPPAIMSTINKPLHNSNSDPPADLEVKDFIRDLACITPRAGGCLSGGFVSPRFIIDLDFPTNTPYVNNHQYGIKDDTRPEVIIDMSSKTINLLNHNNIHGGKFSHTTCAAIIIPHSFSIYDANKNTNPLLYIDRNSPLTIRELARIQGFKDDFVFYGSINRQYKEVTTAYPPVITRTLGENISRALQTMNPTPRKRTLECGQGLVGSDTNKKARGEKDGE